MTSGHRATLALAFVLLVLVSGGLGFLAYTHLVLGLSLERQAILLGLPAQIDTEARALRPVKVRLDGMVSARVPLKQTFSVPLRGDYAADVAFDADIPLHTVVRYQGTVPVSTSVSLTGNTGLVTGRWLPTFPVRAQVPLHFDIPVDLTVPLDTRVHLAWRGPVRFSLDQRLAIPVDTVLKTRFPLARDAEVPVKAAFALRVYPPRSVPAVIEHAALRLPPEVVRFQRTE